jgi:hypothetical protein
MTLDELLDADPVIESSWSFAGTAHGEPAVVTFCWSSGETRLAERSFTKEELKALIERRRAQGKAVAPDLEAALATAWPEP